MKAKKILIRVLICCIIATCFLQAGVLPYAATGAGSVKSSGDLNNDGVVNMNDVIILSKVFNSSSGDSKYIASCDLNNDGAINMLDVVIIAANFNKTVSTATPTATPTLTATPTKTAKAASTPTSTVKPTSTLGAGDWNYNSETTNISIKKVQKGSGGSTITYYIADIKLSGDSTFLTAFSGNTYGGRNIVLSKIVKDNNAIFAVNGDNYSFRNDGYVIRNGQLYREKSSNRDCLILNKNGLMETAYEKSASVSTLLANGANQVLSFGPILVKSGKALTTFEHVPDDQTPVYLTQQAHPRTGIGMIKPNHFIVIVVDGRVPESAGILMSEFAKIFADLGCTIAYNLDGGGSSEMYFNGKLINNPNGGRGERQMSDALYIKK